MERRISLTVARKIYSVLHHLIRDGIKLLDGTSRVLESLFEFSQLGSVELPVGGPFVDERDGGVVGRGRSEVCEREDDEGKESAKARSSLLETRPSFRTHQRQTGCRLRSEDRFLLH